MTMTANEYRKIAYSSKYHSHKTECSHGHVHDSRTEAYRCNILHQLQAMGKIDRLQTQRKYVLIPAQRARGEGFYKKGKNKGLPKLGKVIEKECAYYADFDYYKDGKHIVEDVKGVKTEAYKIKKKLMLERYNILLTEVR
jgi:hypothetical protein